MHSVQSKQMNRCYVLISELKWTVDGQSHASCFPIVPFLSYAITFNINMRLFTITFETDIFLTPELFFKIITCQASHLICCELGVLFSIA